jgi:tetratricopeptide (TPR) repeat protein
LWTTLGVSYKNLGQLDAAKTCFHTASRFKNKLRKKAGLPAYNCTELGKLYLLEGNIKLSEETLIEAIKLSKQANDILRQLEARLTLAECYLQRNKLSDAIEQLEESRTIAEKYSFTEHEMNIVLKLAQCYEGRDIIKYNRYYSRFYQIGLKLLNGGETAMQQHSIRSVPVEREFQPDPPDH